MSSRKTALYAIGGLTNSEALKSVSRYDLETDSWNALSTEIPFKRTNFGCVSIHNDIFVIGGTNGRRDMETMFRLNTGSGQWDEFPPMKYRRRGCSAACSADGKYIFVAGGWDGERCLDVVERYSLEDQKWTTVKPMGVARKNLQLVELGGYFYALGGFNINLVDKYREGFSAAERYDPETDQWSAIAPMRYECYSCGAAVLEGKIYVLGEVSSFEMYSPEDDRWTELPNSIDTLGCVGLIGQRGVRLVAFNGELFAIGGRFHPVADPENRMGYPFVFSFDVENQIWRNKPILDIGRAHPGVAVVNQSVNPLFATAADLHAKTCLLL